MGGATSDKSVMSLVEQCGELDELWTPRNIKVSISLGGTWYDDQGNACTEFPKNISTSVHLRKHKAAEQPDNEESSSAEESSDTAESSEESSSNEESATTEESSKVEESPTDKESALNEESSSEESASTKESSDAEESASSEEASSGEESPTVEESPETEENSTNEESSPTEENSSKEEHETAEESPSEEETEGSGESSSETERSPYADMERIDLQKAGGRLSGIQSKIYDGFAYTPSVKVTVTEGGRKRTLTEGTDYSVTYQQNTDAGQGTAIVRGNGLYKGTLRTAFQITPKPMKKLKVVTGSMTIGSQTEPPVYVYDGTKRLENGKD